MNLADFTVIPNKDRDKFIDSITILSEHSKKTNIVDNKFEDGFAQKEVLEAMETAKGYFSFPKVKEMYDKVESMYNLK